MKFGSLFSGIGGFDLGFERAGMECAWQCEIDKHAQNVLRTHFGKEIYNDVRTIGRGTEPVDLICGGFPCQDVSIAGRRAGLAGERSGLWFEFARIVKELKPGWVVIENVPGLLSSNGGRDFAVILQELVKLGYGVCWRILDAQFFGVPQRRRRVFIVASLGNGNSAKVLFESEGLRGNPPTRSQAGKDVTAYTIRRSQQSSNGWGIDDAVTHTLDGTGGDAVAFNWQTGGDMRLSFGKPMLQTNQTPAVFNLVQITSAANRSRLSELSPTLDSMGQMFVADVAPTLESEYFKKRYSNQQFFSQNGDAFPMSSQGVRRLTPTECERLQGFPDGWTEGQADTQRYKQLGNAIAVPVAEWIGRRIVAVV